MPPGGKSVNHRLCSLNADQGWAQNWAQSRTRRERDPRNLLKILAPRAGFEPATLRLTGERGRSDRVRRSAAKCLIFQPLDSRSSISIAIHRLRYKPAVSAGSCHSPRHSPTSRANGFSRLGSARLAGPAAIEVNMRSGVEPPRGTARSQPAEESRIDRRKGFQDVGRSNCGVCLA